MTAASVPRSVRIGRVRFFLWAGSWSWRPYRLDRECHCCDFAAYWGPFGVEVPAPSALEDGQ